MADGNKALATGPLELITVQLNGFACPPTLEVNLRCGETEAQVSIRADTAETFDKFRAYVAGWYGFWPTLPPDADWGQLVGEACVRGAAPAA